MNKLMWISLLFLMNFLPLYAQNLGNYGEVFPIIEQDIRQVIMKKLHQMEVSGELKQRSQEVVARVTEHVRRPKPLNLPTTISPESFDVDPSIVVNQDIYTHDGTLVAKAGMHLNPFKHISFSKTLFFFNADDPKQMSWVKNHYQQYEHVKFILTNGDVKEASNMLGFIYFDLEGRLSSYFHLKHVPSIVSQKGQAWNVREIGRTEQ